MHQLNPELPLFNVNPLSVTMQLGSLVGRVSATFASSFGLSATLLAAVGIYGVVAMFTANARGKSASVLRSARRGAAYTVSFLARDCGSHWRDLS